MNVTSAYTTRHNNGINVYVVMTMMTTTGEWVDAVYCFRV